MRRFGGTVSLLTLLSAAGCAEEGITLDTASLEPAPAVWLVDRAAPDGIALHYFEAGEMRTLAAVPRPESGTYGLEIGTVRGGEGAYLTTQVGYDLRPTEFGLADVTGLARGYSAGTRGSPGTVSPDGRHLPVCCGDGLSMLRLEDDTYVQFPELPVPENGIGLQGYTWSRDGARVAVITRTLGERLIHVGGFDGTTFTVRMPATDVFHLGWSPDGQWLGFAPTRADRLDVVSLDGTVTPIGLGAQLSSFQWGRESRSILYQTDAGRGVYVLSDDRWLQTWSSTDVRGYAALDDSGDRLLVVVPGADAATIVDVDTGGDTRVPLTFLSDADTAFGHWSPRGDRIVFMGPRDGSTLVMSDLEGNLVHDLSVGLVRRILWSPDGRFVVADSFDALHILGADGARAKIPVSDVGRLHWSPEGDWIIMNDKPTRITEAVRVDLGQRVSYGDWDYVLRGPKLR